MRHFLIVAIGVVLLSCTDLAFDPHAPLERMEVGPNNKIILTDEELPLEVVMYDAAGERVDVPPWVPVHWSVDHADARVTDGVVVGDHGGTVRVTAHAAGLTGGVRVRINPRVLGVSVTLVLNQAVQNSRGGLPLIAGRDVVFRAFVTAEEPNFYESVDLRATFRQGSTDLYRTPVLKVMADSMHSEVIDDLENSYLHRVAVAGRHVQHGLTLRIELDPEGRLSPELGLDPQTVSVKIPVVDVPIHRQMVVPTIAEGTSERIVNLTESAAMDSLGLLRSAFPLGDMEVRLHQLYRTTAGLPGSEEAWIQWIEEIGALQVAEGRNDWHYVGVVIASGSPILGVAYLGEQTAAAILRSKVLAHEIGHNFNLLHSPCRTPDPDPDYPYPNGVIGQWGFDIANGTVYHPRTPDIMGYCAVPNWLSDYGYRKVLRWRSRFGGDRTVVAAKEPGVLIWGSISHGRIELRPAFPVKTVPVLPEGEGDYTLAAIGPDDEVRYEARFTPKTMAEGDERHFHFAIPYLGKIDRIEVTGPEGRDELGRGTEPPMAMLWRGDQVVGIRRQHWFPASFDATGGENTRIVISEGVPR